MTEHNSEDVSNPVVWNSQSEVFHRIDKWKETTLCAKYSAWGTANPEYAVTSKNIQLVDVTRRDGGSICKLCRKRAGRTLCRNCKRPMKKGPDETLRCSNCDTK